MTTERIAHLVDARRRGDLTRDDYWTAMQPIHQGLREYQALVAASGVAALEITPSALVLRLADGPAVAWDPEDFRSPPTVLLNDGAYENTEWAVIRALGVEARTVLDVGANIGWYSLRLAAERGKCPGIHAFEPLPGSFERLAANVRRNGFEDRIARHQFGLSDRDDIVEFFVPDRTGSVAASERRLLAEESQTVVRCTIRRLDEVASSAGIDDIDFIKCDIEGGELGFLRGADATISVARPTIMLELLRKWAKLYGYHPNDVIHWMAARGYACAAIGESTVRRVDSVTDDTVETNFLFVHEERRAAVAAMLGAELPNVDLD